jgi:mannose-1-phosphate guanylyltransferase
LKAVILVGGQGTRLRPLTCNVPKAIVPLLNKPFLVHLLSYLKKHSVNEVILAMGYNPEPIKKSLASYKELDIKVDYVIEGVPLGTAGAVKNTEKFIDDTFIVFNGDVMTEIDLTEMINLHRRLKPEASIALTPVDNPSIYGVVETDSSNMVKRFVEKPPPELVTTNMINAGIYILEPNVLQRIPGSKFFMFERQVFPEMLSEGKPILGYKSDSYWIDIGTPEKYLKVNHDLLGQIPEYGIKLEGDGNISSTARITGPVLIGKNHNIGENVQIKGPSVLGSGCTIASNTIIAGSILWDGVNISENSILKNCIIGSHSSIGAKNIMDNCVIGDDITIAAESGLKPGSRIRPEGFTDD